MNYLRFVDNRFFEYTLSGQVFFGLAYLYGHVFRDNGIALSQVNRCYRSGSATRLGRIVTLMKPI